MSEGLRMETRLNKLFFFLHFADNFTWFLCYNKDSGRLAEMQQ